MSINKHCDVPEVINRLWVAAQQTAGNTICLPVSPKPKNIIIIIIVTVWRLCQSYMASVCQVSIRPSDTCMHHSGAVATQCYSRLDCPMVVHRVLFYFSALRGVTTPLLAHTPNDLYDQLWRKGVPFGALVKKFSTSLPSLPKFKIFHCKNLVFRKIYHFLQSYSSTKVVHWIGNTGSANPMVKSVTPKRVPHFGLSQF